MALAVVFAMLASYLLSRTLVPVLVNFMLGAEHTFEGQTDIDADVPARRSVFGRINDRFNEGYFWVQERYTQALDRRSASSQSPPDRIDCRLCLRRFFCYRLSAGISFPAVDAGQIKLHVRAQPGTRIERTKVLFSQVEEQIRTDHSGE